MSSRTFESRNLLLALVFLGAALRLWQWAGEGSLWLDEIVLARNIEVRSVHELVTYPLAFDQVAPPGFLVAVKLSTLVFGNSERALWLFPLLAGLAGLLLFRRFLITLLAAIAQQYPFRSRLVVFLVPSALLAAAAGAGWIAELAGRRSAVAAAAIVIAVLVPPLLAIADSGLPSRVDHYLPVYAQLQGEPASRRRSGPRFGLHAGDYTLAVCDRDDTRAYLHDLDRFRGRKRVWILSKNGPVHRIPREAMLRYLGTIGQMRSAKVIPSGVSDSLTLELYDLSDPVRLRAASAATFPVKPMPRYPKPGCRDWSGDARLRAKVSRRPA